MNPVPVKKKLTNFFNQGHFDVKMPEGETDDYDITIPDYIALHILDHGVCEDSNGSEAVTESIIEDLDGSFWITFLVYGRVYDKATWPDTVEIKCHGNLVDKIFVVDKVSYPQEMDYL